MSSENYTDAVNVLVDFWRGNLSPKERVSVQHRLNKSESFERLSREVRDIVTERPVEEADSILMILKNSPPGNWDDEQMKGVEPEEWQLSGRPQNRNYKILLALFSITIFLMLLYSLYLFYTS